MSSRKVEIGRFVPYHELEKALVASAKEMGWKVKVEDNFRREYDLQSNREIRVYESTDISIRGRLFSAMKIYLLDKNPRDVFFVHEGFPFGYASEEEVTKYLSAVSRNLNSS